MDPEDVRSLSLGTIRNFIEWTGLPWLGNQCKGHKGPVKKAYMHRDRKGSNPLTVSFFPAIIQHYTGCHIPEVDSLYFQSCFAGDHVGHKLKMTCNITAHFNAFWSLRFWAAYNRIWCAPTVVYVASGRPLPHFDATRGLWRNYGSVLQGRPIQN